MYIVMQLCKMLILATFFPPGDVSSVGGFDVLGVSEPWNELTLLHFILSYNGPQQMLRVVPVNPALRMY